ncbi:hypothetical protein NQ315_004345 [Exocentrus adspersus]|uniref:Sensory neuron membrane protein 2 n=1 Tax=Exocentrus adspersus TaxID=1586481 RepID=A0AAV8W8L8_9CUCU|nr:hypothetical protein NQ315_004345 [Exocentrus adspersus]
MFSQFKLQFSNRALIAIAFFGFTLVCAGFYLGLKVFPDVVTNKIWEAKILTENTEQWDLFMEVPFPFTFKIYIFDVQNPEGILQGQKPVVKEAGPYIYKVYKWKSEVEWQGDDISYYSYMRFEFDKEASGIHTEEDRVTILNTAYNSMLLQVEATQPNMLSMLESVTPAIFGENDALFVKVKVKDYLFDGLKMCVNGGKDGGFAGDMACKQIMAKVNESNNMRVEGNTILFSNLYYKNATHQGRYTVHSGKDKREEAGVLKLYNGKSYITTWAGEKSLCNKIRGVTTIFPVRIEKSMVFESFAEDICRSMAIRFEKEQTVKGILGYRFVAGNDSFDVSKEENHCFCVNNTKTLQGEPGCPKNGVIDMTTCTGPVTMPPTISLLLLICSSTITVAKIYDRCELARELRYVHGLPSSNLSTWMCIVAHESIYDTAAMNPGSGDHGLFQISQLYWCSPPGDGFGCNAPCAVFRDDDISDDVKCAKRIFKEHSRISGDGFNAWAVYPLYCKGDTGRYVRSCFDNDVDNVIEEVTPIPVGEDEDDEGYEFPPLPSLPPPKILVEANEGYEFSTLPSTSPPNILDRGSEGYEFPPLPSLPSPQILDGGNEGYEFSPLSSTPSPNILTGGNAGYEFPPLPSPPPPKILDKGDEEYQFPALPTTTTARFEFRNRFGGFTSGFVVQPQTNFFVATPTVAPGVETVKPSLKPIGFFTQTSTTSRRPTRPPLVTFPVARPSIGSLLNIRPSRPTLRPFSKLTTTTADPNKNLFASSTTVQSTTLNVTTPTPPEVSYSETKNIYTVANGVVSTTKASTTTTGERERVQANSKTLGFLIKTDRFKVKAVDPEYLDSVAGMEPNASRHENYLILEPISGFPLEAGQRIQFNMFIKPYEDIPKLENVTRALIPLVWVEESTILGDDYIALLKNKLLKSLLVLNVIKWTMVGIGFASVMLSFFIFIYKKAP